MYCRPQKWCWKLLNMQFLITCRPRCVDWNRTRDWDSIFKLYSRDLLSSQTADWGDLHGSLTAMRYWSSPSRFCPPIPCLKRRWQSCWHQKWRKMTSSITWPIFILEGAWCVKKQFPLIFLFGGGGLSCILYMGNSFFVHICPFCLSFLDN